MGSHHPIRKTVAPEPVVVPDKLYFRIGDVARLCDVPAYVLRFWETEFPQLKPNKGGTGQRLYRKKDVETALRIKSLLYDQGYTIPGARIAFKAEPSPDTVAVISAVPSPPTPFPNSDALDLGAQIRQDAQQRARIQSLREELMSLASLLGSPATSAPLTSPAASPLAQKHKPMRPRLVLEPAPAPKPVPAIYLNQGDLFAAE